MALPERRGPAFAGDGHGQAVVSGLIQGVVSGAIRCEAIRIAKEQKSVSLAKPAEATSRNSAAKKRAAQEDVGSDYLFADFLQTQPFVQRTTRRT